MTPRKIQNPFDPALHGVDSDDPLILRGAGDLVAKVAKPVAKGIDWAFGSSLSSCSGCERRRQWLNAVIPFRKKSPKPFEEIEPSHERAIVYPWLSTAAVWEELRFSLRALAKHWQDTECPIYIIGDAPPPWLIPGGRVTWIEIPEYNAIGGPKGLEAGLFRAFQIGTQIAREVMWMNDDIYLLRATGWDDLRTALTEGDLVHMESALRRGGSAWKLALADAVAELKERGHEHVWRFATHTPYLFEIEKSREIFRTYYLHWKGSWVTLYHNHHQTPHTPCAPWKVESLPTRSQTARYLNHRHAGPDSETKRQLRRLFPAPPPWELPV